ncbi:MAG: hypothetical protein ABSC05_16005 [Candidatus Solibacter sp.]
MYRLALLDIFHDCGDLLTDMVRQFALELRPVMISLGSSRKFWEDAAVVPKDIVLFGNLPTKTFYSDAAMPLEEVLRRTADLAASMAACAHPHILGSEFPPPTEPSLRPRSHVGSESFAA